MHGACMHIPFRSSLKEAGYAAKLRKVTGRLCEENLVLTDLLLSLWCGSNSLSDEQVASKHDNWTKDINLEVFVG